MKLPTAMQGPATKVPSVQPVVAGLQRQQQQEQALASAVVGVIGDTVRTIADEQQNAAFAKANNSMHDFDREHAGREFYSGDEIPEGINIKRTEIQIDSDGNEVEVMRERIPAYEIQAQMRDAHMRSSISAAAADIMSPSRRAQFVRQMTDRANTQNIKMVEASAKAQNEQIRTKQDQDFRMALLDRDYESASYIANNFNGTQEQRNEMSRQVRYFNESDTYNDAMSEENIPAIDRSIEKLETDGYRGELNEVQRLATLNQLRSKRAQLVKKQDGAIKGRMTMLGVEIDRTIDAMETGKDVPPSQISRLTQQVRAGVEAGFISADNESWIKRIAFFQEASSYLPELTGFKASNLQDQEQYLRDMSSKAKTGTDYHKVDIFKKNHEYAKTQLRSDPVSYAAEVGVADVEPFDFENPSASYREREGVNAIIRTTFGQQAASTFWTKQELADFNVLMDSAGTTEQMRQLSILNGSLSGANADAARSQLMGSGRGVYAVASDALADNQPNIARTILDGKKTLRDVPDVVKEWDFTAAPEMRDVLGNAYGADTETMGQIMAAVKAHYAGVSAQEGDFSGMINVDRLNESIQAVTGGVASYGGSTIVMPNRDIDANSFNSWVRDIDPKYLNSLGGASGYTSQMGAKLFKDRLRSGSLKLQSVGKGQYAVYDSEQSAWVARADDKGTPFVLEYNPDASIGGKW